MADNTTLRMLEAYYQDATPMPFFTSMFRAPAQNFYNSEEVELDIERSGEDISIAVQDIASNGRINTFDQYTNKRFKPPVHKETVTVNAFETIKRTAGDIPYTDPEFRINAMNMAFKRMRLVQNKIVRSIELQCAQVLQTGTATLSDTGGAAIYEIDYGPKTAHFPTVSTDWDDAAATRMADIKSLADVIRSNGLVNPDQLVFGSSAWVEFINSSEYQDLADNRRIELTAVAPQNGPNGGVFQGYLTLTGYRFEMWTVQNRYILPSSGVSTEYMDPKKVLMKVSDARLDMTYGAIPRIVEPDPRIANIVPSRVFQPGQVGLSVNPYLSQDNESINITVGTRPLAIPTAIDRFGCMTVLS